MLGRVLSYEAPHFLIAWDRFSVFAERSAVKKPELDAMMAEVAAVEASRSDATQILSQKREAWGTRKAEVVWAERGSGSYRSEEGREEGEAS